jgi:AraC-like DNA-binding protein
MASVREIFEEREEEFRANYGFNEKADALRSLAVTGELLDLMFGKREAALAMTAIWQIIHYGGLESWSWERVANCAVDNEWRARWQDEDSFRNLADPAFIDELHDLSAFAEYGILPIWSYAGREGFDEPRYDMLRARFAASRDVPAWVESVCNNIDRIEALVPQKNGEYGSLPRLRYTRDLARARLKLDINSPITVLELALLSGVSLKRLQNAIYARTDEAPTVDKNGLISPDSCSAWLHARDYRPSIWKQVVALWPLSEDWGIEITFGDDERNAVIDDFVFVPVANDGTMFSPDLFRPGSGESGGFTIGAKGAEEVIPGYPAAIERLLRMETPRWRRPNPESGKWGIVSGQTWRRVRMSELEGTGK